MLFKERKKWNSVVASWCVKVGRNYKKHRSRKMPIFLGEESTEYTLLE